MKLSDRAIVLTKFFFPFVLGFGAFGIWGIFSNTIFRIWPLIIAYFFPPLGKETIIPLGIGILREGVNVPLINLHVDPVSVDPLSIALAIAFVDIVVALFLVWNYDLAKKIPLVGRFMEKVEKIGKSSEDSYGWVKPLRFIGIILFVMVPFQGSGGLVGSILGRLIGMKPVHTFCAISIGAVTGCLLIAYFSDLILSFVVKNLLIGVLVLISILVAGIMYWINRKNKKNSKK